MARPEDGSRWRHIKEIFGRAVFKARDLGFWSIAKYNPVGLRLVAINVTQPYRIARYAPPEKATGFNRNVVDSGSRVRPEES